jgi:dTDP-4-amino-4,6-dideoxygalactose transaminase
MTDIQAAIGREQLKRLPAIVARRRERAARYDEGLRSIDGVVVPREPAWARSNWQSYAVRIGAWIDQRTFMQRMLDAGIATRRGVMNVHRERAYPPGTWRAGSSLERSEAAQDTAVILPLFHQLTEEDQDRVIDTVSQIIGDL